MNRFAPLSFSVLLALVLGGCAASPGSMNSTECQTADWRAIGIKDGQRGAPMEALGVHVDQCSKSGASVDVVGYRAGRQEGLIEFCTPDKGYEFGLKGGDYHGVCPEEAEEEFIVAYQDGITIYKLKQDVKETERELRKMEREMDRAQIDVRDYERRLAAGVPPSDTARMQTELRMLAHEVRQLQALRTQLQAELAEREKRLETYQKRRGLE